MEPGRGGEPSGEEELRSPGLVLRERRLLIYDLADGLRRNYFLLNVLETYLKPLFTSRMKRASTR